MQFTTPLQLYGKFPFNCPSGSHCRVCSSGPDAHWPRPFAGQQPRQGAGVLPRHPGLRDCAAVWRAGGVYFGRRLPPPHRAQHLEQLGRPARKHGAGLYHTAILYATRAELAGALRQLAAANYPLTGSADHGVSEAIYLADPNGNGVELYWDRARSQWPLAPDGSVQMYSHALDLAGLLAEA